MSDTRRDFGPRDPWGLLAWLLVLAVLAIVLTSEALCPVPQAPTARERAARFTAQERYYEVLDRYGDAEAAEEAARMLYEMEVAVHEEGFTLRNLRGCDHGEFIGAGVGGEAQGDDLRGTGGRSCAG